MQEMRVRSLGQEDPLEKGMATHTSVLAWRIPWTEVPGGLQSTGSQRVRPDLNHHQHSAGPGFTDKATQTPPSVRTSTRRLFLGLEQMS